MAQTLLAFDSDALSADAKLGFDIGWDHARHGLPPPPEQWLDGNPLQQGWRAGKACFGARTRAASPRVRRWLALRLQAWLRGRAFELAEVTPHYLGQIEVVQCPITRQPLAAAEASIDRVCDRGGYAAGNLAVMSALANRAKGALDWRAALARAGQAAEAPDGRVDGLDAAAWQRVATLISFVTPLPHAQAAQLPLHVLPPNRLRVLNPVQGLQALLTREFARPDGTQRLRAFALLLTDERLRGEFHRFVSALLPRRLEAGAQADGFALRHALEDAWFDARVNRCWQRFALQLDEAGVERLLQRCASGALGAMRVLLHAPERATEGWALERGGHALPASRAPTSLQAGTAARDRAKITFFPSRSIDGHLPV